MAFLGSFNLKAAEYGYKSRDDFISLNKVDDKHHTFYGTLTFSPQDMYKNVSSLIPTIIGHNNRDFFVNVLKATFLNEKEFKLDFDVRGATEPVVLLRVDVFGDEKKAVIKESMKSFQIRLAEHSYEFGPDCQRLPLIGHQHHGGSGLVVKYPEKLQGVSLVNVGVLSHNNKDFFVYDLTTRPDSTTQFRLNIDIRGATSPICTLRCDVFRDVNVSGPGEETGEPEPLAVTDNGKFIPLDDDSQSLRTSEKAVSGLFWLEGSDPFESAMKVYIQEKNDDSGFNENFKDALGWFSSRDGSAPKKMKGGDCMGYFIRQDASDVVFVNIKKMDDSHAPPAAGPSTS